MDIQSARIRPEWIRPGPQGPELFGPAADVVHGFAFIERIENADSRARREFHRAQTADILAHARAHSAFWQRRIPLRRPALDRLPILTRRDLRTQTDEEGALPVPAGHGEVGPNQTSGSSSAPLRFFVTAHNSGYNQLRYAFDDVWSGRDLSQHLTLLTYTVQVREERDRWPSLTGTVWRTGSATLVPYRSMTVEDVIASIVAGPMGHLFMGPGLLAALLDDIARRGRPLRLAGEVMTVMESVAPELRQQARAVLGARIADRYSCEEVGPIAFQCRQLDTHYHVASSNVLLETVDDRGRTVPAGQPGTVLITGLNALATPILRYDIGDIASLLPRCPCGHDGQTLTAIKGRRLSLLRMPDGRRRYYFLRTPSLRAIAPVREFRLSQVERTVLVLEVALDAPLTAEQREGFTALLHEELSPDFTVRIEQVERIDWGERGKRITVRNLVEPIR